MAWGRRRISDAGRNGVNPRFWGVVLVNICYPMKRGS